VIIFDPSLAYVPGEVVGTRVTWILSFLGASYSPVNQDRTLSRDTTLEYDQKPSFGRASGFRRQLRRRHQARRSARTLLRLAS
jgi:hypothetical protein